MLYNFTEQQINKIAECWSEDTYRKILQNIEKYTEEWKLSEFYFHEHYSFNAVFFCKSQKYGDCVLKINSNEQDIEFAAEYNVLREYNGGKYVKVYEYDKHDSIMLIERVIPGNTLREEQSLEKRLEIFSGLFSGLHIEPKNPELYIKYTDWINNYMQSSKFEKSKYFKEFERHVKKAKEIYLEVSSVCNKNMLLHVDIYRSNVLRGEEGNYKLIDPKGIVGDPVFDTAHYTFNECCDCEILPEAAELTIDYLEKSINIPNKILKQCLYIETVRFICEVTDGEALNQWDIDRVNFAEKIMDALDFA